MPPWRSGWVLRHQAAGGFGIAGKVSWSAVEQSWGDADQPEEVD